MSTFSDLVRARSQRYPMCALMVAVDALARIQEKQGWKGKDEAIRLAYDALKGQGNFKSALPLRTLCVTYPNIMHVVVAEGSGIKKVADLKGRRVSTGAPGSGTEVKALRTLEALREELVPPREGRPYKQFMVALRLSVLGMAIPAAIGAAVGPAGFPPSAPLAAAPTLMRDTRPAPGASSWWARAASRRRASPARSCARRRRCPRTGWRRRTHPGTGSRGSC